MYPRKFNLLTKACVSRTHAPGLYCDGGGLYLQVSHSGKSWIFRFLSPNTLKVRDMGLGPIRSVGLGDARKKAAALRRILEDGLDPIHVRGNL